ncbi:MAG: hypothetical protein JO187_11185 [Acidobacteria bacterium]|nr:hypothetical protein [Acidobacteriota bacterium]
MNRIKSLFGLLVLIATAYLGWKVLPPFFSNYRFEDACESEALLNSYSNKSETEIRNTLAAKARDYDIPLSADQINVTRNGNELAIWADYTVHIDVPVMPFDLSFHPATKNKRI